MRQLITEDMQILEIVEKHPSTEDVFRSYDEVAGTCVLCNHLFETVVEFSSAYGLDSGELVLKLEKAAKLK